MVSPGEPGPRAVEYWGRAVAEKLNEPSPTISAGRLHQGCLMVLGCMGGLCAPGHYTLVWVAGHLPVLDGLFGAGVTEVVFGAAPTLWFVAGLVLYSIVAAITDLQTRPRKVDRRAAWIEE